MIISNLIKLLALSVALTACMGTMKSSSLPSERGASDDRSAEAPPPPAQENPPVLPPVVPPQPEPPTSTPVMASSVTQYGITWYFDKSYPVGQFVNGDWWVVGPVKIVDVSPRPTTAPAGEIIDLPLNKWGDTGLQSNNEKRNGSMVVMSPSGSHGYDSRSRAYNAAASISFPYLLGANRSLISSISNVSLPNQVLFHALMWTAEKVGYQVMKTAAILTSLSEVPPSDAFRPTYAGGIKKIYRLGSVRRDRLLKLNLDPTKIPSWEQYERYMERPWLDHLNGVWLGQVLLPLDNQPAYGREFARIISVVSLLLHLNVSDARKQKLLISLIQNGIDLRGLVELGAHWNEGGGHTSGRKWPILFAGLMLDEPTFAQMPATALFHEDTQTYYGTGWAGQRALWQMVVHHGVRLPYMHLHPSLWPTYDGGWASSSEGYRTCCTIKTWPGQVLAALLMSAKSQWNHNAYFDNVEDFMRVEDRYAATRGGVVRPATEGSAFESFVTEMWRAHRAGVPAQPSGSTNLMWNPGLNRWEPN